MGRLVWWLGSPGCRMTVLETGWEFLLHTSWSTLQMWPRRVDELWRLGAVVSVCWLSGAHLAAPWTEMKQGSWEPLVSVPPGSSTWQWDLHRDGEKMWDVVMTAQNLLGWSWGPWKSQALFSILSHLAVSLFFGLKVGFSSACLGVCSSWLGISCRKG